MDALSKVNGPRFPGIVTIARNVWIYLAANKSETEAEMADGVSVLLNICKKKTSLTRGKT